jgi:two-component system response regulator AtoC
MFLEAVSPSMRAVEVIIRELAQSQVPVLLVGEPGTGKRSIARRIHQNSPRHEETLRFVACVSLTPDAIHSGSEGILNAGTAFLDEVADLNASCQAKLFDVLSSVANGCSRARLISATSRDLESEVRSRHVREDLYYRLSGVCLRVPPLRQRKEDIPGLVDFFLQKYAAEFHRSVSALSSQTQQLFHDYAWPGNVRELEDAAKAIVVLGDEGVAMGGLRAMLTKSDRSNQADKVSLKQAARAASREAERELILKVLNRTRWNRRRAAEELQISYKALLYKLKQIGYGEFEAS